MPRVVAPGQVHLSSGEVRLLVFIVRHTAIHGVGPTYPEMAAAECRSWSTLALRLERLKAAKMVAWEPRRKGTLRPLVTEVPFGA